MPGDRIQMLFCSSLVGPGWGEGGLVAKKTC